MPRYIKDIFDGQWKWIDDEPGVKFALPKRTERRAFQIVPDIEPFISPIDGKVVSGRAQKREHMRRHDVEELGNEKPKPSVIKPARVEPAGPVIAEEFRRRGIIG